MEQKLEFKIKTTKEYLNEAKKGNIERDFKLTVKFIDEDGKSLEKWDLITEIKEVLIDGKKYENFIRKDQEYGNEDEENTEKESENEENQENESEIQNENDLVIENMENIMENNQASEIEERVVKGEMSENLQVLIEELEEVREEIDEEIMEKSGKYLSVKELCQKITMRESKSLKDYYYLGRKFKKILKEEIRKRIGNQKNRKTDFEERRKIYQRLVKAGVKGTVKKIKRMMEKAEKVYKLIGGIGKEKLNSMCGITTVTKCNNKEIEKAIKYFKEKESRIEDNMIEELIINNDENLIA